MTKGLNNMTTAQQIKKKINHFKQGEIFSSRDFLEFGNRSVIDKTLSRMVQKVKLNELLEDFFSAL